MECIQIVVKIESQDIVNLLKEKGHELENLISLHGNYATFAGDSTFSWKWLASYLPFMNDWYDADCIEFREDNAVIVAALWQDDGAEASPEWYACDGCSDDFIVDNEFISKVIAKIWIEETDITYFNFDRTKWLNARAQKAKPVSNKIDVPSREQITRDWLILLTIADWQDLLKQQVVKTKILDDWENPIFKKLQLEYKGLSYEFPKLALQAIEEGKGWIGVEAIKAKLVPRAKPVLNKK
jgi:hypothetical protein